MNWHSGIKVTLLLAIVAFCLFEYALHRQSGLFQEFEETLLSLQWMMLVCLAIWCGAFLFLTFNLTDLPIVGLLLIAIAAYFICYATFWLETDALTFLAGMTLGRGACFALESRSQRPEISNTLKIRNPKSEIRNFLVGLVLLLAFASWWQLDMSDHYYHGPRWMGLWDNPNVYGMVMSAGLVLTIGLLAEVRNWKLPDERWRIEDEKVVNRQSTIDNRQLRKVLFVAAGMMCIGLLFSYSRGAWMGTVVGLLYLAKVYGEFKLRSLKLILFSVFCFLIIGAWFFWNTPRTASWYLQRLDLSRGSVQHRIAAWEAGLKMMRDHPFGVGWNNVVETYQKHYSPPEGGAMAITTNDYLMLGAQLGWPGLLCFVAYVGLSLGRRTRVERRELEKVTSSVTSHWSYCVACRAGTLAMLVAFWFDGGLFKLATASVFWVLLELGREDLRQTA